MLPNVRFIRAALPAHLELAADFYWILLTNNVGRALSAEEYRHTWYYADLVTDLDGRFRSAYQFAAAAIPYNLGRETWVNGDETLAIIRKGLEQYPDDLTLLFYEAHALMYFARDYKAAAEVLRAMSKRPDSPSFAAQLATRLFAQAGAFDAGLEFARSMRDGATTEEQRAFFDHRIKEIESEQVLTAVDAAAWEFFKREHRQAQGVHELLASGDLASPPVDPLGGEITIDEFGRARTSAAKFRLELYEDVTKKLAPQP